jgi:hypothetical protein
MLLSCWLGHGREVPYHITWYHILEDSVTSYEYSSAVLGFLCFRPE